MGGIGARKKLPVRTRGNATLKTRSLYRQNVIGATWMVTAMAAFAVEDARVKAVSDLPLVGQIMMIFGLGGALIFTAIARRQGDALVTPEVVSPAMRSRVLFELSGQLFYVLALALIPLSTAMVILHATPLMVVGFQTPLAGRQSVCGGYVVHCPSYA